MTPRSRLGSTTRWIPILLAATLLAVPAVAAHHTDSEATYAVGGGPLADAAVACDDGHGLLVADSCLLSIPFDGNGSNPNGSSAIHDGNESDGNHTGPDRAALLFAEDHVADDPVYHWRIVDADGDPCGAEGTIEDDGNGTNATEGTRIPVPNGCAHVELTPQLGTVVGEIRVEPI